VTLCAHTAILTDTVKLMTSITFYQQVRRDGGRRTGIDVDGEAVLMRFDPGQGTPDPSLAWYVDVRCEGDALPAHAEGARRWLLDNERFVADGIAMIADQAGAGVDVDDQPAEWELPVAPERSRITVVICAARRQAAHGLAAILRGVGRDWGSLVRGLPLAEAA
jgi:hypothetical protein